MHHPDFSWLCPLKNIRMNLNSKIITYSHQVGLVGCCFHAGTIGLLWHLYNWLTPSTPDLHAGCSGSTEESAWMPKHALELYWWLLFKAGSEGLKNRHGSMFCAWKREDGELEKLLAIFQTPHLCPKSIAMCICPIYPLRQMPSEQLWVDS